MQRRGCERGVAAERRAVLLERAPVAQVRLPRPEVFAFARTLHRVPDGGDLALEPPDRLVGRRGDDDLRVRAEIHELHPRRPLAEDLLAQPGVELHAAEAAELLLLGRNPARLVVGDHELAVGVELEPVDDAPQPKVAERCLEHELQPDGVERRRVLDGEIAVEHGGRIGKEGLGRLRVEIKRHEFGVGLQLGRRGGQVLGSGVAGASRRRGREEQFERSVHKRALDRRHRRRLGQLVDRREPERERTVLERGHLGRRQRGR